MNNTEWLKQLKVGDKVCVNNEKIGHVVKITKTMVVLGSGRRFNIKSGWQTGNNLYGSSYIEPLTDEKIIELKKNISEYLLLIMIMTNLLMIRKIKFTNY